MWMYCWNEGSEGGKALAGALGIKRLKHEGSKFKGGGHKTVINWGSSKLPDEVEKCRVLNQSSRISICTNKLWFFEYIDDYNFNDGGAPDVEIPEWTIDSEEVLGWVADGHVVCARTVLNGHSAQGLVLIEKPEDFVKAPLYTLYVPKKHEFRVHVVAGKVIDVQRKAKKNDAEKVDWRIRNLANGFIYAREGFSVPDSVRSQALSAIAAVGLDFGAVDIIWNEKHDKAYVLEINTAPGLMGTTLELYAEAFKENF